MPANITDRSEAKFAIFFMMPVSLTQTYNKQNLDSISHMNTTMIVIIFSLLSIVMFAVYMIIIIYSGRIIAPIKKLETYTIEMSQARDLDSKLYVVSQVRRDDTFAEIAAQYEAAKYVRTHADFDESKPSRRHTQHTQISGAHDQDET